MQGFNVLHPMGWDAFGLPAERYAMQTGIHPSITTKQNIDNFRRQLKSLGFSYDWSREVDTTSPDYYKFTQWIFLKLYNSWFNPETNKAEPIETLAKLARAATTAAHSNGSVETNTKLNLIFQANKLLREGQSIEAAVRSIVDAHRLAYLAARRPTARQPAPRPNASRRVGVRFATEGQDHPRKNVAARGNGPTSSPLCPAAPDFKRHRDILPGRGE